MQAYLCVPVCDLYAITMMPDVFYLSDSPASWWRFAFNVVLSRVTEHTRRQTWAFVASRAQLNVRYVRAYTRKLTDPVLDADMSVSCHLCVSAASLPTPMLVNSDGWDGDHSSPGGGWDVMRLLLLLIVRVYINIIYSKASKCLAFMHIFQCLKG